MMIDVRRKPKTRKRANTLNELESAFMALVNKHNKLVVSHRQLERLVDNQASMNLGGGLYK